VGRELSVQQCAAYVVRVARVSGEAHAHGERDLAVTRGVGPDGIAQRDESERSAAHVGDLALLGLAVPHADPAAEVAGDVLAGTSEVVDDPLRSQGWRGDLRIAYGVAKSRFVEAPVILDSVAVQDDAQSEPIGVAALSATNDRR